MTEDLLYLKELIDNIEDHLDKKVVPNLLQDWGEIDFSSDDS